MFYFSMKMISKENKMHKICTLNTKSSDVGERAPRRISNTHGLILHIHLHSEQTHPISHWNPSQVVKSHVTLKDDTPIWTKYLNEYMRRSSLFHLMDFECATSPAPYVHTLFYMPPRNQISIWCQGRLAVWGVLICKHHLPVLTPLHSPGDISTSVKCDFALSKPLHRAHPSLPTWRAGMNNLRSSKSEGMSYTRR